MTELPFKEFQKKLKSTKIENFPQVILIHGEEFLYKSALDKIVDLLLPESSKTLNFDPLDGNSENIPKAIERVNTYSLIPGKKIVALRDAGVFYTKEDKWGLFQKAKIEAENNEMKKASAYFIKFLSNLDLNFSDIIGENRSERLGVDPNEDLRWMDHVLEYCQSKSMSVTKESLDGVEILIRAIEKGFPKDHYLAITTDMARKTHRLYKSIKEYGWIIDCTVPKGEKRADKIQQELVLNERMRSILSKRGKSIEKEAYHAMLEMIGFDIRTFVNELEKLVNYVGERETITFTDVKELLKRSRQDPIFEFTNAITDRDMESSLFLLESLLSAGMHPLQLLTAMANQIRKVINVKGFVENPLGTVWRKSATYNYFQKNVMSSVTEYDHLLRNRLADWEAGLEEQKAKGKKRSAKTKAGDSSDLFIMKNPKNPYPTYQLLKKSDHFSMVDLKAALNAIKDGDMVMKTTAQNPKRVLEDVVFKICVIATVKLSESIRKKHGEQPHGIF
jgi:DNA polymerase III subunit delta